MQEDPVRMWRPSGEERVLLMAGPTSQYGMDPRGEYVFGIVDGKNSMRSRRGRERRLVQPGQLVAWDPSATHEGSAVGREPWTSRLMVIEVADLEALSHDPDSNSLADVHFPVPVLDDPLLAVGFNDLFQAFDSASTQLERDERLAEWLQNLIAHSTAVRPRRSVTSDRGERALQIAFDYLGDQPERNVGLDELADAADLGNFGSSGSSASEPGYRHMRCRSLIGSDSRDDCSRTASPLLRLPPPRASPTRATFTDTSNEASA